jgi:hypothetical protein
MLDGRLLLAMLAHETSMASRVLGRLGIAQTGCGAKTQRAGVATVSKRPPNRGRLVCATDNYPVSTACPREPLAVGSSKGNGRRTYLYAAPHGLFMVLLDEVAAACHL